MNRFFFNVRFAIVANNYRKFYGKIKKLNKNIVAAESKAAIGTVTIHADIIFLKKDNY